MRIGLVLLVVWIAADGASSEQAPNASQSLSSAPRFDAVSIRRNTDRPGPVDISQLPGGGFTLTNGTLSLLMGQAFPVFTWEIVGLPDWSSSERYDIIATGDRAISTPTQQQRNEMLRAMLADRFKLVTHYERREQPMYHLVLARDDGRLGPRISRTDADCTTIHAAAEAARAAGQPRTSVPTSGAVPVCSSLSSGNRIEGDIRMDTIARRLRGMLRRHVVDKTGLVGYFRVDFELPPDALGSTVSPGTPSIFTALQEQLGLKLEPARGPVDVLLIDSVERPTPN